MEGHRWVAASDLLLQSGFVAVEVSSESTWVLTDQHQVRRRFLPVSVLREGDPAHIHEAAKQAGKLGLSVLFIVDRVSPALQTAAASREVSYVALRDRCRSIAGAQWPPPVVEPSNPPWGLFALARVLLRSSTPIPQSVPASPRVRHGQRRPRSLASAVGLSQGHVSSLLRSFPAGMVSRRPAGWAVNSFDDLWDWHGEHYPGPLGMRLGWRGTRQRRTQIMDLRREVKATAHRLDDSGPAMMTSAYDALPAGLQDSEGKERPPAPERRVATTVRNRRHGPVVLYSAVATSTMTDRGYMRCEPGDASVQLVRPADPTLARTAAVWGDADRTDPLITAWELTHGPTGDDGRAADLGAWARKRFNSEG